MAYESPVLQEVPIINHLPTSAHHTGLTQCCSFGKNSSK